MILLQVWGCYVWEYETVKIKKKTSRLYEVGLGVKYETVKIKKLHGCMK